MSEQTSLIDKYKDVYQICLKYKRLGEESTTLNPVFIEVYEYAKDLEEEIKELKEKLSWFGMKG